MVCGCERASRCGFWIVSKQSIHLNERPPSVRRRKADLRQRVNRVFQVAFTESGLTSYAGLELLVRYLLKVDFNDRLRFHLGRASVGSDFGAINIVRLLIGMLVVGGRRLHHLEFLDGDPLIHRFCGLAILPSSRTVSRWLKKFQVRSVEALRRANAEMVAAVVSTHLTTKVLTIDIDGTVLSTGQKVARAFRGYNPHHRKVPSYYPITAHLSETGHVLRVQNRSGNINDGKASIPFLRGLFQQLEETLEPGYRLCFRMDGDYFKNPVLQLLDARGADYAIKVPFWRWLDIQGLILAQKEWERVDHEVEAFRSRLCLKPWRRSVEIVVYRKRVHHPTRKAFQLDLFDPDNGNYEFSAIATNLSLDVRRLWRFMCGRGSHEKIIGELKSGLAFDTIPTNHYGANSAWQQIVTLTHNILINFQIDTGAQTKPRTQKRTTMFFLKRIRTLRYEVFNRAGNLVRPHGRTILRLGKNTKAQQVFTTMASTLDEAA